MARDDTYNTKEIVIDMLANVTMNMGGIASIESAGIREADEFQQILKDTIPQFKEAGVSLFIWDGVAWYNDPRNMTAHTIIETPAVWLPFEEQQKSVAEWLTDAISGKSDDYGVDLIEKEY